MKKGSMSVRDVITLSLLVILSIFLYADQRIMTAILPELQVEYGIDVKIMGLIGSVFTLVGAAVSLLFGFFTDKVSRKALLVATILIGEIPCLLTGIPFFTGELWQFVLLRVLTGIGIGGIYPISFSLIADYFKEEHRASASAWIGVAWAVGMMIGPAMAGYLTPVYGWRISFILAAVPNFFFVAIFALYAKEPARGRTEAALAGLIEKGLAYNKTIRLSDFKLIFSNKTNLWTFLQGIPGTIPWGVLGYWVIHFMEEERGLAKEDATTMFLLLGVGATLGSVLFAMIGGAIYRKKPAVLPFLCGAGILLGAVPMFVLLNLPLHSPTGAILWLYNGLAFLTGILVSVPAANVKAILMNVNRPEHRGSVFAVFNLTDNLGQGFGPMIGGLLIPFGYVFAMNFSVFWWIPCGILFFFVAGTIVRDRDILKKLMAERAEELEKGQSTS
jgi:MFS family permease